MESEVVTGLCNLFVNREIPILWTLGDLDYYGLGGAAPIGAENGEKTIPPNFIKFISLHHF